MIKIDNKYTESQNNVISDRGHNLLVSASAGTGKTTVMIERIAQLLAKDVDVSEIVVVTFTNLAAAEMKNRLAQKLSAQRGNSRAIEQLEKLDSANISTLHSFCSELLRNYFYIVDIDPTFTILDSNIVATLRKNALDEVFLQYFVEKDEIFMRAYKIFATSRQEDKFKNVIYKLYEFSRCINEFSQWYLAKRRNLTEYSDNNALVLTILDEIKASLAYYAKRMDDLAMRSGELALTFASVFEANAKLIRNIDTSNLQNALFGLGKLWSLLNRLPSRSAKKDFGADKVFEEKIRQDYESLRDKELKTYLAKYSDLCRGNNVEQLWTEINATVEYLDKLVEIVARFDETFYRMKKERGGIDFNDLEHLTLQLLKNEDALSAIKEKYKLIFVDEYQDTNPVQEAIIVALAQTNNLFMVGDVKQSIYGFRGCEPQIFVDKKNHYQQTDCGVVQELNDNFRSNKEILDFVNEVFDDIMTVEFGKVDYANEARLKGATLPVLKVPSISVDLIVKQEKEAREIDALYDITQGDTEQEAKQGDLIARRIKDYVGLAYKDKNGNPCRIGYGDIVILMRSLTGKAIDIYNSLISANIPVVANFKVDGYSSKEVRDLINLFRALDNPYNDVYIVGACLSPFGGFSESELGTIRLDTEGRIPFYDRLQNYARSGNNDQIKHKIDALMALLVQLRFYSRSASVSEVAIKAAQMTDYQLYIQSLPNGALRMRKWYAFIDGVKDVAYGESIEKFLAYIDESDENKKEESISGGNAVRMMTMHASKGLEFPIVFVVGLETPFQFDDDQVMRNFDLGIAMDYYDFDEMRFAPTLSRFACNLFNKNKQREEEMRLLYVAMTRAKYVLAMTGVVDEKDLTAAPKMAQKARSNLEWILDALKKKYKTVRDITESNLSLNIVREIPLAEQTEEQYLCKQSTDEQSALENLDYVYPYEAQKDMPSKVVSSQLDKEYLDVSDSYEHTIYAESDRNFVGTAYHKVYQYVDYTANKAQIKQTIDGLVHEGKIERRYADKLDVDLIFSTLNNAELAKLLQEGAVYHEIPFMLLAPYDLLSVDKRFSDDTMLQGVIDLLVIGKEEATVIDFKYTAHSDKIETNYAAQLNSYKLAVQRICGIEKVSCYVLSIADNKLIKIGA